MIRKQFSLTKKIINFSKCEKKKEKKNLSLILFLISLVNETNKYLIYLIYEAGLIETFVPHRHGTHRTESPTNHSNGHRSYLLNIFNIEIKAQVELIFSCSSNRKS